MIKVTNEATEIVTTTVDIIMAVTAMMKMMVEDMDITNVMMYIIIIMVTCMMMVNIIPMEEVIIGIIILSVVRF